MATLLPGSFMAIPSLMDSNIKSGVSPAKLLMKSDFTFYLAPVSTGHATLPTLYCIIRLRVIRAVCASFYWIL